VPCQSICRMAIIILMLVRRGAMITKLPSASIILPYVLKLQKAALPCTMAALAMPYVAKADCNINGPIGAGTAQFQGFLAATSSAAISAVTSMNTGFQSQSSAFVFSPRNSQPDQSANGFWGRAVGGRMDTETASTGEVTLKPGSPLSSTCETYTRNDYNGFQGGYDFGRLNLGASGWNAHLGVAGGVFDAEALSKEGSGTLLSTVPFVGVYGALVNDSGFFIDGQVMAQFYRLNVSEPSIEAQGTMDSLAFGITSSAGYTFPLGNDYFIQPSVGVVYSRVHLDSLYTDPMVLGATQIISYPAKITLGDIETLPARVGVMIGKGSIDLVGVSVSPFVTASIWHEFAGNTIASATWVPEIGSKFGTPGTFSSTTTRIGTFGQYSFGANVSIPGTGWLGYARVDYRNGQNIEALSVNGGLRYQFAPVPAAAAPPEARMYTKAPAAAPTPGWAGFYVGGFAGAGWAGDVTATELAPGPGSSTSFNGIGTQSSYRLGSSGIGGFTFGYNYQAGSLVAGLEAEGGYIRLSGSALFFANPDTVSSAKIGDWYAALTGRFGFTLGPALIYGKGGAAIVDVTESVIDGHFLDCTATPCRTVAAMGINPIGVTWIAGAGLEYALSNNWSVKGEYLVLGTQASDPTTGPGLVRGSPAPQMFNWEHDIPFVQTAKIGLNYKM
jgi:outer membrane autotransporter protein